MGWVLTGMRWVAVRIRMRNKEKKGDDCERGGWDEEQMKNGMSMRGGMRWGTEEEWDEMRNRKKNGMSMTGMRWVAVSTWYEAGWRLEVRSVQLRCGRRIPTTRPWRPKTCVVQGLHRCTSCVVVRFEMCTEG